MENAILLETKNFVLTLLSLFLGLFFNLEVMGLKNDTAYTELEGYPPASTVLVPVSAFDPT